MQRELDEQHLRHGARMDELKADLREQVQTRLHQGLKTEAQKIVKDIISKEIAARVHLQVRSGSRYRVVMWPPIDVPNL